MEKMHYILKALLFLLFFLKPDFIFSQWQIIPSGDSSNLVDGCFVTDSTAFAVSTNGTILQTNDAGNTWTTNTTLAGSFTSICHVGTDTIYVGGNCLYRSDDAGVSWNLITTFSFTITDLGFFGSQNGFMIVPNYFYCTWVNGLNTFEDFQVYKTTDYGLTWQVDFGNRQSNSRFQFINDSTAYVTGGAVAIFVHCSGTWYDASRRTNDRGNTWFGVRQPDSGKSHFSFIDNNIGYFVQLGNKFNIYKTIDGGMNLTQHYTEIDDPSIKQCKFMTEIDGYLLGWHNIYASQSNGFEWHNDFNTNDNLNFLFDNSNHLLIGLGSNGLIVKKDFVPSTYRDTIYRVRLDQNSIDFGLVAVNSTSPTKTLTISNTGDMPLNLNLASSNHFKLSLNSSSFINNLTVSLIPFQDTVIYIQFSPLLVQPYNDTLLITADSLNPVKVPLSGVGAPYLSGVIWSDTLICIDTLRIGGDVTIHNSAKVTICAGTYVQLMGNYKIIVEGTLEALGDSIDNIQFGVIDTIALWGGILLNNPNYSDTSVFNYCDFIVNCNNPLIDIRNGIATINHCNFSNKKLGIGAINLTKLGSSPCQLFISNSAIYNTAGSGIACNNCDNTYVSNNNIYGNRKGTSFSTPNSIVVSGNNIHHNSQEGIYAVGKLTIEKNKIYNNAGGIYFESSGVIIENNEIYNNNSNHIGGIIGIASVGGMYINQNLIFNNYSAYANSAGILLSPSVNYNLPFYVTNNTICNNKTGSNGKGNNFYAITNNSPGVGIVFLNNIIYSISNIGNNIAWFSNGNHDIQYNCINQDSVNIWGQNNIDDDPRFVAPTTSIGSMANLGTYDWSLKQNSHCINAGNPIDTSFLLPLDIAGNPRIYNNRVDIGAYEFQADFVDSTNATVNLNMPIYTVSIFPNPTNESFTVSTDCDDFLEIMLYDITARQILKKEFLQTTTINIGHLPKGVYIYKISTKNSPITRGKLIKN